MRNAGGTSRGRSNSLVVTAIALACLVGFANLVGAQGSKRYSISIASTILAEPGVANPLPIQIAGDELPKNSFIRIRGLPASATLSEGHMIAAGSWAVPLSALPTLKLTAPISESGKSQLTIALVGIDGTIWAEAKSSLAVVSAASIPIGSQEPNDSETTVATVGPAGAPPPDPPAAGGREAPDAGAAATPQPPALSAEDRERAIRLLGRGDQMMEEGDVASARLYYERAVDIGLAEAAISLAETYDPGELNRWPVMGLQPNIDLARQWYERALQLGAPEAGDRLRRLSSR